MSVEIVNGAPYLPGAAALLEQLDRTLLLVLRDGRHLVGKLRSVDQFLNLVLEDTYERVVLPGKYCDVPLGLYIVRGDNIVILGEIDPSEEDSRFVRIEPEQLSDLTEELNGAEKVQWDFDS